MLRGIVGWSLRRPRLVAALFVLLSIGSYAAARRLHIDLLPPITPRQLIVWTEAPGISPSQVEQLVTTPIERAIGGVAGVREMRSSSTQGLSTIDLDLAQDANAGLARQILAERLGGVTSLLPAGARAPQIAPLVVASGPILTVALTSERVNGMKLREAAQWFVKPRLIATPGVAQVSVYGGDVRRIEVRGRPGDLADSDLGLLDLVKAAERVTSVGGAGFLDTPGQRILVESHGQAGTAGQIAQGQIQVPGAAPVRIGDVSDVVEAPAPGVGDALLNGHAAVLLQVSSYPGTDRLEVTRAVQAALDAVAPQLRSQGIDLTRERQALAERIAAGVRGALLALGVSLALLTIVMWSVLRDLRAVLVSLVSLAVSVLLTAGALALAGVTLNAITLGGFALGLGLIIDDAVLDVEFVLAQLRRGSARPTSRPEEAILRASLEVRAPVFIGALLLIFALAPLLALTGFEAEVLRPLVIATLIAALVSMVVTASLTPALAVLLLKDSAAAPRQAMLGRLREATMSAAARLRPVSVALVVVGGAVALLVVLSLKTEVLPTFSAERLSVQIEAASSLSRAAAVDLMGRISRDIGALPDVTQVTTRVGRDPTEPVTGGLAHGRLEVLAGPAADLDRLAAGVRRVLAAYPGIQTSIQSRISPAPGEPATSYRLSIYGGDYEVMGRYAAQAAELLKRVPGARDVRVASGGVVPVMRADVDFSRLALYGLSAADVVDTVQAAFAGRRVATIYDGVTPVDVVVTAGSEGPQDPDAVGGLLLRSTSGVATPLSHVAWVSLEDTPSQLRHVAGQRMVSIYADPAPEQLEGFAKRARATLLAQAPAPAGVVLDFGSADGGTGDVRLRLATAMAAAVSGMLLLLLVAFRNPRTALVVMAAAALGLAGAAGPAAIVIHALNLGVIIGLIAVFGLSARGAILLLSRIERLVETQGAPWSFETILRAARERFIPSVLSNLLLILAIGPLALAGGPAGELLAAMAVTLLGGLLLGGILILIALPGFVFAAWRPPARPEPLMS